MRADAEPAAGVRRAPSTTADRRLRRGAHRRRPRPDRRRAVGPAGHARRPAGQRGQRRPPARSARRRTSAAARRLRRWPPGRGVRPQRPHDRDPVAHERRGAASAATTVPITTSTPPPAAVAAVPTAAAAAPWSDVGDPRAAGDHDDEDALQPAADGVGGGALQHAVAERRRGHVGGAADHQHQHREPPASARASGPASPTASAEAGHRQRPRPGCRRARPGPGARPGRPSRRRRRRSPRRPGCAANSSAKARPPPVGAAEVDVRDLGEQRPRHPEDHRDQVDHERHQQHRVAAQVAPARRRTDAQPGRCRSAPSTGSARQAAAPRHSVANSVTVSIR